jgi:hypothetical protein
MLDTDVSEYKIVYITIFECISEWGAMASVMFATFAFLCLKYNATNFYK